MPFARDAYRIENGTFVVGAGYPTGQCTPIEAQKIITHPYLEKSKGADLIGTTEGKIQD